MVHANTTSLNEHIKPVRKSYLKSWWLQQTSLNLSQNKRYSIGWCIRLRTRSDKSWILTSRLSPEGNPLSRFRWRCHALSNWIVSSFANPTRMTMQIEQEMMAVHSRTSLDVTSHRMHHQRIHSQQPGQRLPSLGGRAKLERTHQSHHGMVGSLPWSCAVSYLGRIRRWTWSIGSFFVGVVCGWCLWFALDLAPFLGPLFASSHHNLWHVVWCYYVCWTMMQSVVLTSNNKLFIYW